MFMYYIYISKQILHYIHVFNLTTNDDDACFAFIIKYVHMHTFTTRCIYLGI